MGEMKSRWKRAPRDQRRLASSRTAPNARFTRGRLSSALPPPLPSRRGRLSSRPLLILGAMLAMIGLSIALVIAVGAYMRAEQQTDEMQWRAGYYGLPTQPFPTPTLRSTEVPPTEVLAPALSITAVPNVVSGDATLPSSRAALTEPDSATAGDTLLSSFCDQLGLPQSITIFDWNDWSTVDVTNPMLAQLPIRWDAATDLWRGYGAAKPFDVPDDARERWQLHFADANGDEHWIHVSESASTPGTLYAYAFQVITPYADKQGGHFGYHPCRAFSLPQTQMDILLSAARAYGSSGSRYPALASLDDARWSAVTITPLSSSFDLRGIPTLINNDPLQTLSQRIAGSVITDAAWGVWAQAKLGDTVAWIDTSTVTLETAETTP